MHAPFATHLLWVDKSSFIKLLSCSPALDDIITMFKLSFLFLFLVYQDSLWIGVTAAMISQKDIESYNYDAASKAYSMGGGIMTRSRASDIDYQRFPLAIGDRCDDHENLCNPGQYCSDEQLGRSRRCIPASTNCLADVVEESGFDFDQWQEDIFSEAGLSLDEFVATRQATTFEEFQDTSVFEDFISAFISNVPLEALQNLQEEANACNNNARTAATGDTLDQNQRPKTSGTVVYMGLHIEVGFVADIAMSVFWALGENDAPTAFIRGTFGAELGAGAEISGLLGFAFSGTTSDILGDAVAVDSDILVGPAFGIAIIANINGLVSLEFTLGVGVGGGGIIGVAYAITAEINPPDSSPAPPTTMQPSAMPSTTPLPASCSAPAPLGCPAGTGTGAAQSPISSLSAKVGRKGRGSLKHAKQIFHRAYIP